MKRFLWAYPRAWRKRYGDEFLALLEQQPPRVRDVFDILVGALLAHRSQFRMSVERWPQHFRSRIAGRAITARRTVIAIGVAAGLLMLARTPTMHVHPPVAAGALCTGQRAPSSDLSTSSLLCTRMTSNSRVRQAPVIMSAGRPGQSQTSLLRSANVVSSSSLNLNCSLAYVVRYRSPAASLGTRQVRREASPRITVIRSCTGWIRSSAQTVVRADD